MDVIVLLTGDGDFVPLVEYLHGRGVIVEVAAFAESTNAQLKVTADRFIDISTEGRDCLMGSKLARAGLHKVRKARDEASDEGEDKGSTRRPGNTRRIRVSY